MRHFITLALCTVVSTAVVGVSGSFADGTGGAVVIEPIMAVSNPVVNTNRPAKRMLKRKKNHRKKTVKSAKAPALVVQNDKMSLQQVQEALKAPGRDLSGKNLSGLHLVGMNLSKANLRGADLRYANLERADFEESNLERADLSGANLKRANLRLSSINATNFDHAVLDNAIWKDGLICVAGSVSQCLDVAVQANK